MPIRAFALLLALLLPWTADAINEDDLLPVEEAFALRAVATARDRIEFSWTIAEGYYLYRHRMSVQPVESNFKFNPLQLPAGKAYHDEFFGDVETYRGSVTAVLTGAAAHGVEQLEFNVRFQGCADLGVCYPPHTQSVTVSLPSTRQDAAGGLPPPAPGGNPLLDALRGERTEIAEAEGFEALPLPPEEAFGFEAIASSPTELLLRFTPAPGYYLYRDRSAFRLTDADGEALGTPRWPPGVAHEDEHFGKVVVYFGQVEVPLGISRSDTAARAITLEATFQGCQNDGICYPPMTRAVRIDLPRAETAELIAAELAEDSRLAAALAGPNRWLTLLSFYGFGLLLAFTPCVFPMVPILSGILAGAGTISTARSFVLSFAYVLSTAVVFTIAGVLAGLAGQNLQAAFQHPAVLVGFALVFVALALSMFGFYELQLPGRLQTRLTEYSNRHSGGSLPGVVVMGVLSALIVGPCVAPPLAAAVLYISQTRDPVLGGVALFALAMGMGTPLLAVGTAAGRWLPRAGIWMDAVKAVFGVLFLGLAIWMLERILEPFWIMLMSGALLIGCAVYLGALERLPAYSTGWHKLRKAGGVLLLALGALQLIGAAAGGRDVLRPLHGTFGQSAVGAEELPFVPIKSSADLDRAIAEAGAQGKPVLFDFYADWCVACKEMEKYTFTEPSVHAALAGFVLLKADVTAHDAVDQALMQRFGVVGPPATLFFGRDGNERRALRLYGFEKAPAFTARIKRLPSAAAAPPPAL